MGVQTFNFSKFAVGFQKLKNKQTLETYSVVLDRLPDRTKNVILLPVDLSSKARKSVVEF